MNPASFALELKNPAIIEEMSLDFRQHGAVMLSGQNFDYVAVNITTPQNKDNQEISSPSQGILVEDFRGNKKLMLEQRSPLDSFKYSVSGTAKISAMHLYSLPGSYTIPEDARRYLFPSKNIQSDSEEIRNLAREITKGAGSDFEKISRLALWVNINVNYTLDLGNEAKDAVWVLHNRIGTCDEFTALFMALARSIGIPAKYVSGYVYGENGWQKHAWAEVYLGKWISVDATWFEVGRLDATHIKFFETDDNYVANEAKAYGSSGSKLTWVDDETDFVITGSREVIPADYDASISAEKLSGGDIVVVAKITPDEYMADRFVLEPCTGMDILRIDEKSKKQNIVIEPKKETILWWKLSINPGLDKSKIYTCPIVLNSNFFKKKTMSFDVDPRVHSSSSLVASIDKSYFSVGETATVTVADDNVGAGGTVGIATDDYSDTSSVILGSPISFSFRADSPGTHTLIVYDSSGSSKELAYSVQEQGSVSIEKIEGPAFALVNSKPELRITIKNGMSSLQNIKLDVKVNDRVMPSESFSIPAKSIIHVNKTIPSGSVGDTKISVRLSADSVEEVLRSVRIYDEPEIVFDAGYDSMTGRARINIIPQKDEAKNIEVTIAGRKGTLESSLENKTLYFEIPAGEYSITAKYEDVAGKHYKVEGKIKFEERWWEKIISLIKRILG